MLCMLIHHELTSLALYWSIDVSTINVELQTFKKKQTWYIRYKYKYYDKKKTLYKEKAEQFIYKK